MYLHEKLEEYEKNGHYPMHMPGHKRQLRGDMYAQDITEIDGFDNLHHSEDILKSDREKAALFYGAGEARFLVNGSTCGVLAAISAVTDYGDSIIIGRNSHKSAYHAIQLRGLRAEYVYPDVSLYGEWSIDGPIPPEEVRRLLERQEEVCANPTIQAEQGRRSRAVFLTSPTYEGVISDVRQIADICHAHGVPLIVDEAHGAHLKVMEVYGSAAQSDERETEADKKEKKKNSDDASGSENFFRGSKSSVMNAGFSAVDAGADLVILGLHKTMPVLTQGALLVVSSEAIREGRVSMKLLDEYLGIYESSSPSYILMGSISRCIHWLDGSYEIEGRKVQESAAAYQKLLDETRQRLLSMKYLRLFPGSESNRSGKKNVAGSFETKRGNSSFIYTKKNKNEIMYDPGKIVISTKGTGLTGQKLADWLRKSYRIEIEMTSADYMVAMTSMFDTEEGMKSFADAVLACDAALDAGQLKKKQKAEMEEFPRAKVAMSIAEAVSIAKKYPQKVKEEELLPRMGRQPEDEREEATGRWSENRQEGSMINSWETEGEEKMKISTEFVYVYPPGIPIVAPGEIITKGVAKKIIYDYNSGCALIGCVEEKGKLAVRCIEVPDR